MNGIDVRLLRVETPGGIPVILSQWLTDGEQVLALDPVADGSQILVIGTRPLTELEFAGAEGRHIVRRGMDDVLEWIGEEVGPAPRRSGKGRELFERIRDACMCAS